jgi:uncharacterized repeat protein (TIGR02543 family)
MKKYLALVLAVVAALTACDNGADTPQEELARVRIGAVSDTQGSNTRSVLPTAPALENVDWFALYGTASTKASSDPTYQESWLADLAYQNGVFYYLNDEGKKSPAVVYLRPGDWRFTLYAYQGENAALKGTATITITAGFAGIVNFTLSPYSEAGGTGSVFLYLDLPEGSGVASVETTIDGDPLDPALAVEEDAVVYENDEMPTGQYLFSFMLKDSAGKTILVVSDVVVVTSGAESAKEYALTAADFNAPPAAPSALAVASYNAGNKTFQFTWQDNSFNETGFTLSDGTTTSPIAAAAQAFNFPVANPTASATYTLKAVNSFGESAPAQINGPFPVTITFDAEDGNAAQTRQVNRGASVGAGMPANPTRTDYTFDGWYTAQNGGGSAFTADTIITNALTLYAKWTEGIKYELTKNPADSTFICNTDSFLEEGFYVAADERVTVSFSIKTDTVLNGFYVGIGDWNNSDDDGWIASGEGDKKSVAVDGQFHPYTWSLSTSADAPAGYNPLVFRFVINGVSKNKVTVYVKDVSVIKGADLPSSLSLAQSLEWIQINAEEDSAYTITLKSDNETITPKPLSYNGKNVSITLNGGDAERAVSLSSSDPLFTIGSGVTLTLGNNVSLQGRDNNTTPLILVSAGGALVMGSGSKISGNNNIATAGGGVSVAGTFTMNGGEISGNEAPDGSGVNVASNGTFTMTGGVISGNEASSGGGVNVASNGTFTMTGGAVNNNTAFYGGGVYTSGAWTMSNGIVNGNTATDGGGVYVAGTFTMSGGGTIGGNTASSYGGGVNVSGGTFIKESGGGTIYGSNASDSVKNTAGGDGYGHAVYIENLPKQKRNATAGANVTLDSTVSDSTGGWEYDITNITYTSTSGGASTWTLQSDGRRMSPLSTHNNYTSKARVNFTSNVPNASITIGLDVSSYSTSSSYICYAFISTLDYPSATYNSGYFEGSRISGTQSVTITIPVPTVGEHFIEIGFQRNNSYSYTSEWAQFRVLQ